jgi:hypothetical protein
LQFSLQAASPETFGYTLVIIVVVVVVVVISIIIIVVVVVIMWSQKMVR